MVAGAPEIYTEEWLEKEAALLLEWTKKEKSRYFKTFCVERGYSPQRLSEFSAKSKKFSEAHEFAKGWQECKLVNLALDNKVNSGFTKFLLVNNHDYKENNIMVVAPGAATIPPEATDTSRDLVHESR